MTLKIEKFLQMLRTSREATVICGAGISSASQIPLLGNEYNAYKDITGGKRVPLASLQFLKRNPRLFYKAYREVFIDPILNIGPSVTHYTIQRLIEMGLLSHVITSNIDTLQQRAGTSNVIELWNSLNFEICTVCGANYDFSILEQDIPICTNCGGIVAPLVLVRGLSPSSKGFKLADRAVDHSDLLIYVGTSGTYYDFKNNHARSIVINPDTTSQERDADLVVKEKSENFFNQLKKYFEIS